MMSHAKLVACCPFIRRDLDKMQALVGRPRHTKSSYSFLTLAEMIFHRFSFQLITLPFPQIRVRNFHSVTISLRG